MLMVTAMHGNPARRRILEGADSDHGERVLQPFRAEEAAMRKEPVITKADAERAEDVGPEHANGDTSPAEEPRHEGQQRSQMVEADADDIQPVKGKALAFPRDPP